MTTRPLISHARVVGALAAMLLTVLPVGMPESAGYPREVASMLLFGGSLFALAASVRRNRLHKR